MLSFDFKENSYQVRKGVKWQVVELSIHCCFVLVSFKTKGSKSKKVSEVVRFYNYSVQEWCDLFVLTKMIEFYHIFPTTASFYKKQVFKLNQHKLGDSFLPYSFKCNTFANKPSDISIITQYEPIIFANVF